MSEFPLHPQYKNFIVQINIFTERFSSVLQISPILVSKSKVFINILGFNLIFSSECKLNNILRPYLYL